MNYKGNGNRGIDVKVKIISRATDKTITIMY